MNDVSRDFFKSSYCESSAAILSVVIVRIVWQVLRVDIASDLAFSREHSVAGGNTGFEAALLFVLAGLLRRCTPRNDGGVVVVSAVLRRHCELSWQFYRLSLRAKRGNPEFDAALFFVLAGLPRALPSQ